MSRSTERELLNNLETTIKERITWSIDNGDYEDLDRDQILEDLEDYRHEMIDGELPIYYHDMAKLLAENTRFADVDDPGILPENPTVWDIITMSVYEWMSEEFFELACDAVDELMPHLDINSQLSECE